MYIKLMEERRSVRSFKNEPISSLDHHKILQMVEDLNGIQGPFKSTSEFSFIPVSNHITPEGDKIGTYGIIRNPAAYVVGVTKNERSHLIDFGYVLEKFMLDLLDLKIGTCWLGGTFDRKMLMSKFEKSSDHIIPAIAPIGYMDQKPSLIETTMRKLARSDNKFTFENLFFKDTFGTVLEKKDAGLYEIPLEVVRLGPSASNKQPWRLIVDGDTVHFFLKHTPNYSESRLKFDMQFLDIGIAMFHFESAVNEIGLGGHWRVVEGLQIPIDDPNVEYVISWEK